MVNPIPTTKDVARKIPTRTRTRGGHLLFDFSELTEPATFEVVDGLIDDASKWVFGQLPDQPLVDDNLLGKTKEVIILYTAMQIELGLFPEQVTANRSPYPELKKLYDAGLADLLSQVGNSVAGGGTREATYSFPPTAIGDGIMP